MEQMQVYNLNMRKKLMQNENGDFSTPKDEFISPSRRQNLHKIIESIYLARYERD